MKSASTSAAFYLAVLPAYRQRCIDILLANRPDVQLFCSAAHLDPSVRTGIRPEQYTAVRMTRVLGRLFFQSGGISSAMRADVLVVDLNPRSMTAWLLLATRRLLRKRTLAWGHLYPQAGPRAATRGMRHIMRRLAHGTISYTYQNARSARVEMPDRPVWVAPNALYTREELEQPVAGDRPATHLLYVGRFEPAKKVALLIAAFRKSAASREGAVLHLVGGGSLNASLRTMVSELGLSDVTVFRGWVEGLAELRQEYSEAFAATSPGFAGLGVTQALGFGVPIIVSKDEPHSPEIELADIGGVYWAESNDPDNWARAIDLAWKSSEALPGDLRQRVVDLYSADAMAGGLMAAIDGQQENIYGQ